MNQHLGIGGGAEDVALLEQPVALLQFGEVVDLAVEDDPHRAVFIGHGLVAVGGRIDDRKPPVAQRGGVIGVAARIVRAAVRDRARHAAE